MPTRDLVPSKSVARCIARETRAAVNPSFRLKYSSGAKGPERQRFKLEEQVQIERGSRL